MYIKRNIQFSLKKRPYKDKDKKPDFVLRMRISYEGMRVDMTTGYSVGEDDWDSDAQRVKKNRVNKRKQTASDINAYLAKCVTELDEIFREYEVKDVAPTQTQLVAAFKRKMNLKEKETHPGRETKDEKGFWAVFGQFITTESTKNSWSRSTVQKFITLKGHLRAFRPNARFEYFNSAGLTAFLSYLVDEVRLTNRSVLKLIALLKWFLRWAARNGYHDVMDFRDFKPRLSTTTKKVIFLTPEEIRKLLDTRIPDSKRYLDRIRDVFVFCCFTGLRHSDVYALRRSDVKEGAIEVTTQKTADSLVIELNDVSRRILKKYEGEDLPDGKALPVISNQKMNVYLKELCQLAGLDEPIRDTVYQGSKRADIVLPKYELVKTHAGRRSFICNALAAGIPVNVVMKWTGHSDYQVMKPYIDVADKIKAKEMDKMNKILL